MLYNIQIASFSHIGNKRENQEDNYILKKGKFLSPRERKRTEKSKKIFCYSVKNKNKDFLVAVSDGMGGHSSGEVASLLTVKYLSDNMQDIIQDADNGNLNAHFLDLNKSVTDYAKKHSECRNMGATLCGFIRKGEKIIGFNLGDSRLYRFENKVLRQLSVDHTEGQRLLNLNILSEEELENFPRKKHLYKYIGANGELVADIFDIDGCVGKTTFLLCSDGLSDVLSDSEIESILNSSDDIQCRGKALVEEALKRNEGYGDNITVLLVDIK